METETHSIKRLALSMPSTGSPNTKMTRIPAFVEIPTAFLKYSKYCDPHVLSALFPHSATSVTDQDSPADWITDAARAEWRETVRGGVLDLDGILPDPDFPMDPLGIERRVTTIILEYGDDACLVLYADKWLIARLDFVEELVVRKASEETTWAEEHVPDLVLVLGKLAYDHLDEQDRLHKIPEVVRAKVDDEGLATVLALGPVGKRMSDCIRSSFSNNFQAYLRQRGFCSEAATRVLATDEQPRAPVPPAVFFAPMHRTDDRMVVQSPRALVDAMNLQTMWANCPDLQDYFVVSEVGRSSFCIRSKLPYGLEIAQLSLFVFASRYYSKEQGRIDEEIRRYLFDFQRLAKAIRKRFELCDTRRTLCIALGLAATAASPVKKRFLIPRNKLFARTKKSTQAFADFFRIGLDLIACCVEPANFDPTDVLVQTAVATRDDFYRSGASTFVSRAFVRNAVLVGPSMIKKAMETVPDAYETYCASIDGWDERGDQLLAADDDEWTTQVDKMWCSVLHDGRDDCCSTDVFTNVMCCTALAYCGVKAVEFAPDPNLLIDHPPPTYGTAPQWPHIGERLLHSIKKE